jgi:ABC-type phosphate/phosphonate transport system substrate-binding protein
MIASLPMYDLPPFQAANDRLWAGIRDRMRAKNLPAPEALTRGAETLWPQWESPDLILSQTCGMPYRTRLHGHVTLIGTPDFGVEGCPPGYYRSVFIAHKDDPRQSLSAFSGSEMAYNEDVSQSGWAAPLNHAKAAHIALKPSLKTGGHMLSLQAVAEGRAPLASLDAVTFRLLQTFHPQAADIKVIGQTDPTPGLPLIAAKGANAPLLFTIIAEAIAAMPPEDKALTGLRGLIAIAAQDYLNVPTPKL